MPLKVFGHYRICCSGSFGLGVRLTPDLVFETGRILQLIQKTRIGSKVTKKYDTAMTPYQRVLQSVHVSDDVKKKLRKQYRTLNPASLKRQITRLQQKLLRLTLLKSTKRKRNAA